MVGPDDGRVLPHALSGCLGDVGASRHLPLDEAQTLRDEHDALRHRAPQRTCDGAGAAGEHHGEGNDVGWVRVVEDAGAVVCRLRAHSMDEDVTRQLARGCSAVGETPDDAVAVALRADLDDADALGKGALDEAQVLAGAGDSKELACHLRAGNAKLHPGGVCLEGRAAGLYVIGFEAVGDVAAVGLVPTHLPTLGAEVCQPAHELHALDPKVVCSTRHGADGVACHAHSGVDCRFGSVKKTHEALFSSG